jgi:putative ABC transport system permease protein
VLKALGADGALARNVYLIQIAVLAALGVAIGLVRRRAAPLILGALVGKDLPIPALFAVYPGAAGQGRRLRPAGGRRLFAGAVGRARATPPAALFRRDLAARPALGSAGDHRARARRRGPLRAWPSLTAPTPDSRGGDDRRRGGRLRRAVADRRRRGEGAGRLRAWTRGAVRIGLANLAGPRSAARTASPAIGLGVALLAAVVLIQSSLLAQVRDVAPRPPRPWCSPRSPATGRGLRRRPGPGLRPAAEPQGLSARALRHRPDHRRAGRAGGSPGSIRPDRWAFDNDISLSALGARAGEAGTSSPGAGGRLTTPGRRSWPFPRDRPPRARG